MPLTQEEVLIRFRKMWNDKYDYSKLIYTGYSNKVIIICRKHGEFQQYTRNHWKGSEGCKKCMFQTISNKLSLSQEEILKRFKNLHGDRYDYSKITNSKVITIGCKQHGWFDQTVEIHLMGSGCPQCGILQIGDSKRYKQEEFIEKANQIHSNKYDYSKSVYSGYEPKIIIICSKHGEFKQSAGVHLAGHGCWRCSRNVNNSKGEEVIRNFLLKNEIQFIPHKSFKYCRNPNTGYKFYFDFWLPDFNLCIEYDGAQHFMPVSFISIPITSEIAASAYKAFKYTQYKDSLKTNFCLANSIKLLRISYLDNIRAKLEEPLHPRALEEARQIVGVV